VWVIQNGAAQVRNVTTGTTDNNQTQVTGLNPGEVVADSSFEKLQNGSKVNVVQQPSPGQGTNGQSAPQKPSDGSAQTNPPPPAQTGSKTP
jgi:multidrug efflux system membrane fusion protein